jgi:hypothetical protein
VAGDEAVAVGDNICSLFLQPVTGASGAAVNPLGFAHWSGTSFATAYISGNFAASAIQLNGTGTLDESMPCTP